MSSAGERERVCVRGARVKRDCNSVVCAGEKPLDIVLILEELEEDSVFTYKGCL